MAEAYWCETEDAAFINTEDDAWLERVLFIAPDDIRQSQKISEVSVTETPTTLQIHEMSDLDAGIDKSGSVLVYRSDDSSDIDNFDPVLRPVAGEVSCSFSKTLRIFLVYVSSTEVFNLRWYSSGVNEFGDGISIKVKNLGVTWVPNVDNVFGGVADLFSFTANSPLSGDSIDIGPFDNDHRDGYIGDLIRLQMRLTHEAETGVTPDVDITFSYDEV